VSNALKGYFIIAMPGMFVSHNGDSEFRRTLAHLAASPAGVPEDVLVAQGIAPKLITDLMRAAYIERVTVKGRAASRDLIRITTAGWRFLMSP
jgi:hypothetical protein